MALLPTRAEIITSKLEYHSKKIAELTKELMALKFTDFIPKTNSINAPIIADEASVDGIRKKLYKDEPEPWLTKDEEADEPSGFGYEGGKKLEIHQSKDVSRFLIENRAIKIEGTPEPEPIPDKIDKRPYKQRKQRKWPWKPSDIITILTVCQNEGLNIYELVAYFKKKTPSMTEEEIKVAIQTDLTYLKTIDRITSWQANQGKARLLKYAPKTITT